MSRSDLSDFVGTRCAPKIEACGAPSTHFELSRLSFEPRCTCCARARAPSLLPGEVYIPLDRHIIDLEIPCSNKVRR